MAEKVAADLHLHGISASSLQLQELKWTTKERIWLQLLEKNPSSKTAWEQIKILSDDRKQVRGVERIEELAKETIRKNEDSYRADFMKYIEVELARIGAPTMITWQRLVMEKDCNYQAMRILVTRIKSSQKKRPTSLPIIELKPSSREAALDSIPNRNQEEIEERSSPIRYDSHGSNSCGVRRSIHLEQSASKCSNNELKPEWNNDFTDQAEDVDLSASTRSSFSAIKQLPRHRNDRVDKESTATTSSSSTQVITSLAPKPPSRSTPSDPKLTALQAENASLKKQLEEMQALQDSYLNDSTASSSEKKIRYLQAKNFQLQRQNDTMLHAIDLRQNYVEDFNQLIESLQDIVRKGTEEAKNAGAEQNNTKSAWMMAIPSVMLKELNQIQGRINSIQRKCALETYLNHQPQEEFKPIQRPKLKRLVKSTNSQA